MGLFKRNSRPDGIAAQPEHVDLGTMLLQGTDMIDQLAQAHMSWGLGSADRWDLDQRTGMITWVFSDKTATLAALALRITQATGNRLLPRYRKRIDPDHHLRSGHSDRPGWNNLDLQARHRLKDLRPCADSFGKSSLRRPLANIPAGSRDLVQRSEHGLLVSAPS